jgi:outer membrane protein OmpA-like peptidoglycan-associated protein
MKAKYILLTILACMAASSRIDAQTAYLQGVKTENLKVYRQKGNVSVAMDITVDGLDIRSNDMVILTPVIKSNHDGTNVQLAPVILAGSRRSTILRRKQHFHHPLDLDTKEEPYAIVKRDNRKIQTISYNASIPGAGWMKDANLVLKENVKGCADCNREGGLLYTVNHRILPGDEIPVYQLTYLVPEAETKTLSDSYSATFNYVADRYDLHRDYKDNAVKLDEVSRIIRNIQDNSDFNITRLEITGYASPEASVTHNRILARNRARSFADYLVSNFGIPHSKLTVKSYGEDWKGLREAVDTSSLSGKQAVLDIIDQVSNPDKRDARLKKLSGGSTYRILLDDFYPPLRRTEYTIVYHVRPFSVEEARKIIKTNPRLLNLNEMYMVARSYPTGSKEFKDVFDISARLYPDNRISIINSASADIEGGNADAALERLSKIKSDPKTYNDFGVAYARKGNFFKAKEYLDKAVEGGDDNAAYNLRELEKVKGQQ